MAAPRSILRATSAQASLRTRSASRRDNSPSSALTNARKQHVGNDQTEDVIAEKFEALIAARPALAAQCRNMRERALEQRLIGKFITDPCLKFASASDRPSAHLTIVKSRLQRTDHGQLQMCQAGSPSPMEKKMICALPTRFSNGTYPTADSTRLSVELSRLSPIMK